MTYQNTLTNSTMIFFSKFEWQIAGDSLRKEVESLPDGRYQLEITSLDTRNLQQNALLWGWTYPHIQKFYHDAWIQLTIEQIHEYYKYKFLRKRKKCPVTKKFRLVDWSTKKLSVRGFSEYLKKLDLDCIDKFGCSVPLCHEMEEYYGK